MSKSSEIFVNTLARLVPKGTRAGFAKQMGMSPTQFQEYVTGQTVPTLELIDRMAAALKVHPWELVKPEDQEPRRPECPHDLVVCARKIADYLEKVAGDAEK